MPDTLEFSSLPLIGVHVRLIFESSIEGLGLADADLIAKAFAPLGFILRVREEREILGGAPLPVPVNAPFGSLGLENQAAALLIFLQEDHLKISWMRPVDGTPPYPRFTKFKGHIEEAVERLRNVLGPRFPKPSVTNLRYDNFVGGDHRSLLSLLRDSYVPQVAAEGQDIHQIVCRWRAKSARDRALHIDKATLTAPINSSNIREGFLLGTVSGSVVSSIDEIAAAIESCHSDAIEFFADLLSKAGEEHFGLHTS